MAANGNLYLYICDVLNAFRHGDGDGDGHGHGDGDGDG